jgi:hypothetical protein
MPLTADVQEPYPRWAPYAIASIFAFFSVFGLTMFSVKVPGPELNVARAKARTASTARKIKDALGKQAPGAPRPREAPAIVEAAEAVSPCTEEAIVDALDWLTGHGKVVSLKAVAGYLNVPQASVTASPHVNLVHNAIAWQKTQKDMAAA